MEPAESHHFKLPRARCDREAFVLDRCRGRSVLHVGCADAPSTKAKLAAGTLLHPRVAAVARQVVGLDLDAPGLQILAEAGYESCVRGDAEDIQEALGKFDVVLAGEVVEHLSNPGKFLASVRKVMTGDSRLILTVPNAFRVAAILRIPFGRESVHPDHVFYFSHRTLEVLCRRHGFEPVEQYGYRVPRAGNPLLPYAVEVLASWVSPNLTAGLIHTYRMA